MYGINLKMKSSDFLMLGAVGVLGFLAVRYISTHKAAIKGATGLTGAIDFISSNPYLDQLLATQNDFLNGGQSNITQPKTTNNGMIYL